MPRAAAPGTVRGACDECAGAIVVGSRRSRFCSDECSRRSWYRRGFGSPSKLSSVARGYGQEHRRLRAELLPAAYGTPCGLCGELMLEGQSLHLDHTEDRQGYRGFSHAGCNVVDGARRGAARLREKRLAEGRRVPLGRTW